MSRRVLAHRIIHEQVDTAALAVARLEAFDLSLPPTVTRKSGPSSDAVLEWLRLAARWDFADRVYA